MYAHEEISGGGGWYGPPRSPKPIKPAGLGLGLNLGSVLFIGVLVGAIIAALLFVAVLGLAGAAADLMTKAWKQISDLRIR